MHEEIEILQEEYGHGSCHDLTIALSELYETDIVIFFTENSNLPIHSAILLNKKDTLDAYGISPLSQTYKRYNNISKNFCSENLKIINVDIDRLISVSCHSFSEPEDITDDIQPLFNYYNINLESILKKK